MATQHKLYGERINPSRQSLKRRLKTAETIEGFQMKPGYLYTVVRAISARVNQNYDGWPSDELKKSAHTFVGKPVFVNHENYDPEKARGVVVAARYIEKGADKYIEVIQEIDAKRFPLLAHEIRTGGLDSVSMGAEAGFTICSYCGNKAFDVPDMCEHVLFHKGERLSRFNRRTGKREEVLVYESCHKLSFFELSYVFDPADETAVASKVVVAKTADYCPPGKDCNLHDPKEKPASGMAGFPINDPSLPSTTPAASGAPAAAAPAITVGPISTPAATPATLGTPAVSTPAATSLYSPANTNPGLNNPAPPVKTSAKCHYCAGDADEGFSSCTAHRPMEDNKFKAAVLKAAGFTFEDRVLAAFREGASNPFTDSSGRYQGPMKTKTSYPPSPYGADDTCTECGAHFTQSHAPGCSKASKWGSKMNNFEARVLQAAGMHRMPDHPGRHESTDPRVPPEGFQVQDASDWLKTHPETYEARVIRAWGETEAPAAVDTLRDEGSAPEDDNNDFYHYVEPPKELQAPDLSEAAQIDREQDQMGTDTDGEPGPASPDAGMGGPPAPQQQYMELKIPLPSPGQAGADSAPAIPMQPYQDQPQQAPPVPPAPPAAPPAQPPGPPQQQIAASTFTYFDRYFGHRVGRINLQTLENEGAGFTKSRNPMKGTANMARSTLAERGKVVTAGRRQHFAEGPLVDSGDQSRNDQGEQEEVFISETPPAEPVDAPTDDTPNISNTENNLVAKVRKGRDQLLRDAQALQNYRAKQGKRRTAGDQDEAGGPVATEVDPSVNTGPAGEELTGNDFESADPNEGVVETQPKDASLHAFKQFDRWLAKKTGQPSRNHTSATIRRAANDYSRAAGISVQAMFPALGIVLREARKNEKPNTKGAKMRKRADEELEVAAPDGRIDVEAPVEDTTDAEAQASQFDLHDFGNNAGDNIADPDLSTDQNWAPGEANDKTGRKVKTAGGILAFRCAEAMIAAGLEPNTVERKYALASEFENMNRGLVQDRVALCERFAAVLQNTRRQVASGGTRGANLKPPVPTGLAQGAQRTASIRVAANDPRNDSSLFV